VPGSTPRYTPEFRAEAVRLVHSSPDKSIVQIARELGISDSSVHGWLKQSQIDAGQREGLTTEEQEELRKLRKEVKTLRQERDILKKATVDSTGQCNTVGFECCLDRRWVGGEAGSSWRVVGGRQEGTVAEVEGWGVHLRHSPGSAEASRLHSRGDREHRRHSSTSASSA
jgi:transposase